MTGPSPLASPSRQSSLTSWSGNTLYVFLDSIVDGDCKFSHSLMEIKFVLYEP